MKYVALDFETANNSYISACSIGVSLFEDTKLIFSRDWLLHPPKQAGAFDWYHIKVNKIKPEMVEDSPTFDIIWPQIAKDIEGSVLICHNAPFDTMVLCKTLLFYGLPLPYCKYLCTVQVAKKVWPELENHKLNTVSQSLGIPLKHHEAGSDALAAGLILQAALQQCKCANAEELADKIGIEINDITKRLY